MNEIIESELDDKRLAEEKNNKQTGDSLLIRCAGINDAVKIWQLVKGTGVLDLNSAYCYLLLCTHFSDTCLVAESNNKLAGFVSAYKIPGNETTLFIWQTGVANQFRGQGIAKKLLLELINSSKCKYVNKIEATISPSNIASMALFKSLAREFGTKLIVQDHFSSSLFPNQQHEKENLVSIGPFKK